MSTSALECRVRLSAGAYVTSRVAGLRASSTQSELAAVERLAEKVFGKPARKVVLSMGSDVAGHMWRATL